MMTLQLLHGLPWQAVERNASKTYKHQALGIFEFETATKLFTS